MGSGCWFEWLGGVRFGFALLPPTTISLPEIPHPGSPSPSRYQTRTLYCQLGRLQSYFCCCSQVPERPSLLPTSPPPGASSPAASQGTLAFPPSRWTDQTQTPIFALATRSTQCRVRHQQRRKDVCARSVGLALSASRRAKASLLHSPPLPASLHAQRSKPPTHTSTALHSCRLDLALSVTS